ncbi:putative signaling protein [Actinoplanes sp. SE50]|uniref:putative bifunctional diguanylate cyclase/phosphodiesterase n=1 Tax=unclassified Actinoplanes TaxID=2626549 RepID=UPI00023ECC90|nr:MULTISPECIES: bifunctional diguanylate cyclase/phosphodiesterase [unclassified Actinoplanes]AEV83780.1 putative signaling protein [Actinoplanes sp. SE50/110]ATO82076.1 putative signaling protein [Actinoplanes sp. SE50]SLL99484.1 signaling protein [Actinoplanes sp. SE50/110]
MRDPVLADLAVPVPVTPAGTPVGDVEAALRADPELLGVLTESGGELFLIDRAFLDLVLAGRLGYGRALLHRRPLRSLLRRPALVLPAATDWGDAARAAMERPDGSKAIPIVVALGDDTFGLAPVGPLVEHISRRYQAMALTDDLTGLGNRRSLMSRRAPAPGAAAMVIDLNRFKEINDTLGHTRGDELLRQVAVALSGACRPAEAFRLGGDEFVVFTPDLAVWPGLSPCEAGHRLLHAIQGPFPVGGVPVTVEASMGIAVVGPGDPRDLEDLVSRADSAMYAAKRDRTQVELWHGALAAGAIDLGLDTDLWAAIGNGELVLHYQPLVDAQTRATVSVEALVRWSHPRRGLLPPGVFLPQAERSDVIHMLTAAVLGDAVRQAATWHRAGRDVPVAVNLAAPVLSSDRVLTKIGELLDETGLPPRGLIVEVTESAVMTRPAESADRLRSLRAMGVGVAIDDFGTGNTSLGLLTQLPLSELKLDRSFVTRIHQPQDRVIIESVARMANGLGLTLVAEGVEDADTADTLTALGFDLLQGYHFGRPEPIMAA